MQTQNLRTGQYVFFLAVAGALLFFPFLGRVHLFDWDEINFAECSREMMMLDDYTRVYIDFKPFWEKPPMFFWMQAAAMKVFGINEFAARLPNAICGIMTILVVFLCGKKMYSTRFGLLWALAFSGSLFPNMYFKSGIIDPWFNLFIFISYYFFILYSWKRNGLYSEGLQASPLGYVFLSGMFMGLAILMKGQVALIMFLLAAGAYLVYNRFRLYFGIGHAVLFLLTTLLVTVAWYGYETYKNGPWFITEFIRYQYRLLTTHDAGQKGFFGYHYVMLLIGCFPASIFAIFSFFEKNHASRRDKDLKIWMLILFWVVTILFTIVQSRIIHYSSLAWFPVTFLAANTFYKWEKGTLPYKRITEVFLAVLGGILAFAFLVIPFVAMNLRQIIPYVHDRFAQANMEADVHWTGWESLIGVLMGIVLVLGISRLRKGRYGNAAWIFFGGTALFIFLASAVIVPKIERYSQGAAVDFMKERRGEDCYVHMLGYKSYAQLFYTLKEKPVNQNAYNQQWLLTGEIDKPVYFVTKVDKIDRYGQYTDLKELYRKNGFVFLKREIP